VVAFLLISPPVELLGALTPRVEVRPADIVDSDGELAADLMAAAGKPLEQWQSDGVDLMMSTRPDGKWACFEFAEWVARQQGKGVLGEARVTYGLLVLDEEITWSAHLYMTALIAFRRIREVFRALGQVHQTSREEVIEIDEVPVKVWNSNNDRGFERMDTGRRISFFARSKGGLRGASPDVNVIDEAFAYTFEQQDAIMPTLIAKPNAQTIYLSSPPLTGDTGEVMYELKTRAEGGQAQRLGYRDWGLKGHLDDVEKVDLDDRSSWAATCPGLGRGRVTVETIQALRDSMSRKGFGREVLGLWPRRTKGGGAIDMTLWAALLDGESRRAGDVAIAVDIAPERDYSAIGLYGRRDDGIGHAQLLDYRPGTDWVIERLLEWRSVLDPVAIGMGRATAASLELDLKAEGVTRPEDPEKPKRGDLMVLTSLEMTAATGQLLDAVKQASFRHVGQAELDASAEGAKTKLTGDTLAWARKEATADTSPIVTVTCARWVFLARVDATHYDPMANIW
jgi:hypothetical protein